MEEFDTWSIEKSRELYGIKNWGASYFDINEDGNINVYPNANPASSIDLSSITSILEQRDIEFPVLLRFNDIIRHRIKSIYDAFSDAIKENDYEGKYLPAYPVKVNQQKHIVDVIKNAGNQFSMGLEVGSKPELIAVLAIHDDPNAFLLCNGYKDKDYIELALSSIKVGRNPIIIIEKFSELDLVIEVSKKLNVNPSIGFRLKLSGKGAGRWENSGGDRAKFGLTVGEIVKAYEKLKEHEMLDALKLIHFHAGSQLTSIAKFSTAIKEATQVYVQLKKKCKNLNLLDVGGGLGVDYDGSKSNFSSSMNYSVGEYARDVVWNIDRICKKAKVKAPHIITEAGRATVAYSSLLIFDVLGIASTFNEKCEADEILKQTEQNIVINLANTLKGLSTKNCQESLHDAISSRNELINSFSMGLISIEDRALGDKCYWAILRKINILSKKLKYIPEDIEKLNFILTDIYFCNFSIFQSMPDSWAIDQIFPIMPISRLKEKPECSVVLADITCDSDGCISKFADLRDINKYLKAHKLKKDERYFFGAFLVGAYQEILGDLHNLFGDTNAVHIEFNENGKAEIADVVEGDTVREVLKYIAYEKEELCAKWRRSLDKAVADEKISNLESSELFKKYSWAFEGYTYLKN